MLIESLKGQMLYKWFVQPCSLHINAGAAVVVTMQHHKPTHAVVVTGFYVLLPTYMWMAVRLKERLDHKWFLRRILRWIKHPRGAHAIWHWSSRKEISMAVRYSKVTPSLPCCRKEKKEILQPLGAKDKFKNHCSDVRFRIFVSSNSDGRFFLGKCFRPSLAFPYPASQIHDNTSYSPSQCTTTSQF